MLRGGTEDGAADSGADTAGSDCSKMSSASSDVPPGPGGDPPLVAMHILANPGDSLLLQHSLDRLLGSLSPGSRFFHVSERACPLREPSGPAAGWPSLAVTLFLHECHGEQRVLRVLDSLRRPPWRYHHTEGGRGGDLLPSRDFYSLGPGMPLWAVRSVHCGSEALRVTLHCSHADFEDAVRLYETVLRRGAEEPKPGFCWFPLRPRHGLQLALKRLAAGVHAQPCHSAVLQFPVDEIGQLVPLLPNPCTPISATRWQTEDFASNKILFQVRGHSYAAEPPPAMLPADAATPPCRAPHRPQARGPGCPAGGPAPDSGRSTPASSSCYSSLRSSPTVPTGLLLQETDVDTGCAVAPPIDGGEELRPSQPASEAPGPKSTELHCGPAGATPSLAVPRPEPPAALPLGQALVCGYRAQEEEFFI